MTFRLKPITVAMLVAAICASSAAHADRPRYGYDAARAETAKQQERAAAERQADRTQSAWAARDRSAQVDRLRGDRAPTRPAPAARDGMKVLNDVVILKPAGPDGVDPGS